MKKIKSKQVFYSVKGSLVEGGAMLSRGVFDSLGEAMVCYKSFTDAEIWRHNDENGKRVGDLKIYDTNLKKKR